MSDVSKLWLVARKELRMTATRAYLISTAVGPLLIVALTVLPVLLGRSQIDGSLAGRKLAVVAADSLLPAVRAEFAPIGLAVEEAADDTGLSERVRAGDLDGYVVFPPIFGTERPRYVTGAVLDTLQRQLTEAIGRTIVRRRLELAGLDAERVASLTRHPDVQVLVIGERGEVEQNPGESFLAAMAVIGLLFLMVEVYGQTLGRAVLTEKTGKTAEIMLSSMKPFELLAGKVLGKGLAGLLQFLAWLLVALLVVEVVGPLLGMPAPPFVQSGRILAVLGFFVLGFLLYSAVYAIAGAIAADAENYSQLVWPVFVMQIVSMVFTVAVLVRPDGPLAVTLSMIPVTAPVVMFMRLFIGNPGAVQVAIAVAGVVLLTAAVVWAAGKAFRLGILLTGKKGTFREVVRLLRA